MSSAALAVGPAALALGPSWLDPNTLLEQLGDGALWGAMAIIFAECGLLLGFFLPGDTLLFTVGLFVRNDYISYSLWMACLLMTLAAFAGNVVGYEIGRVSGPAVFNRPNSKLFKRENVDRTAAFFDRYGALAIIVARFVPVVRTFITVSAGVGRMNRGRFLLYSAIGAVLWGTGVTVLGYLLGTVPFIRDNVENMLLLVVAATILPALLHVIKGRIDARRSRRTPAESTENRVDEVREADHEAAADR
jgi:membrane-associated protein